VVCLKTFANIKLNLALFAHERTGFPYFEHCTNSAITSPQDLSFSLVILTSSWFFKMPESLSFGSKIGVLTVAYVESALIHESRVPDEDGAAGAEELSSNQVYTTCNKNSWKRRLLVTFNFLNIWKGVVH
jgi:hypothetical protein